jgi:hypothetical protein
VPIPPHFSGGAFINTTAFRDVKASDFFEDTIERIFGMTHIGSIGLFLKNSQVGDRVVLFSGCSTPFLVRPAYHNLGLQGQETRSCPRRKGDGFELVGPCYVYGLADSQARAKVVQESQEMFLF